MNTEKIKFNLDKKKGVCAQPYSWKTVVPVQLQVSLVVPRREINPGF
jgi:hypothetical protein